VYIIKGLLHKGVTMDLITYPAGRKSFLGPKETEIAIKSIKDFFELNLATELSLSRVTAPLFVLANTGINDDLSGTEQPVSFHSKALDGTKLEIVQSLAKWKRMMLGQLSYEPGYGLYTDMNAIRPDEESLDNTHSLYVDQWDWERVITPENMSRDFLEYIVKKIYSILKRTEHYVCERFSSIKPELPEEITFIHAQDLLELYPQLSPRERENKFLAENKAAFIIGIGGELSDGSIHDMRAPDYDNWSYTNDKGEKGLNGDIFVWNNVLGKALELSSMGIRVDKAALIEQLTKRGCLERMELMWHKMLLNDEMPLSIGGGIGQSRLCMYYLRKVHIGEVQACVWPKHTIEECKKNNINLL
jgi:aspartate--ammonia ligase